MSPQVHTALKEVLDLEGVSLLDSAEWYRQQFGASGNWDSWVWETVTGRDYGTRQRHFGGFVVVGDRLGRASAEIVRLALQNGRVVLHWAPNSTLSYVQSVTDCGEGVWQVGKATQIGG